MIAVASLLSALSVFLITYHAGSGRGPARQRRKGELPAGLWATRLISRLWRKVRRQPSSPLWEEAFYAIAFHLRAGETLPQAILAVSGEGAGTPYEILRKAARAYEAGASMLQALQSASEGSDEMHRLAGAVEIGMATGSDLPLLLCHSAEVLAKRRSLKREARAKMAESRITAVLLSAMPWIIGAVTYRYDSLLMTQALSGPRGRMVLIASLGLWLVGNIAILATLASVAGERAR